MLDPPIAKLPADAVSRWVADRVEAGLGAAVLFASPPVAPDSELHRAILGAAAALSSAKPSSVSFGTVDAAPSDLAKEYPGLAGVSAPALAVFGADGRIATLSPDNAATFAATAPPPPAHRPLAASDAPMGRRALERFVKVETRPLVTRLTKANEDFFFATPVQLFLFWIGQNEPNQRERLPHAHLAVQHGQLAHTPLPASLSQSPRQHSCRPLNLCAASPLWPPSTRRCPTLARSSPFSTWHRMGCARRLDSVEQAPPGAPTRRPHSSSGHARLPFLLPSQALPTPTLLAFSLANNSKFVPLAPVDAGSLSAADVTAFAAAVAKAEVVPHIRSEGDSTTSRGGSAVVKLVGKTFDAAVKV